MSALARLGQAPWIWAYLATVATWLGIVGVSGIVAGGEVASAALTFATFFVIVALGQMFVVSLGPGNVDLAIPATMTLAGTVATKLMASQDPLIAAGLLAALAVGVVVGCGNYALIRLLQIPPIIATLSSSFVIQSTAIWWNRGLRVKPPPELAAFTTAKIGGVPVLALAVIALAVIMHVVLTRTVYGRSVLAIGQNANAARLAGIAVERTRFLTYLLSALLASLCGCVLAAFSGGASLNMGQEYLLASIAVVVIGGTSVAGGFANVPGIWGAALFLFLLVTLLNTLGLGAGVRLVLTGLVIIAIVTIAGGHRRLRT